MKNPKWQYDHYKNYKFRLMPYVQKNKLLWKEKHGTPRCELLPQIRIEWLWFVLHWVQGDDRYWEQKIWIEKFNNGDVDEAKDTWPWMDAKTRESTWRDY